MTGMKSLKYDSSALYDASLFLTMPHPVEWCGSLGGIVFRIDVAAYPFDPFGTVAIMKNGVVELLQICRVKVVVDTTFVGAVEWDDVGLLGL